MTSDSDPLPHSGDGGAASDDSANRLDVQINQHASSTETRVIPVVSVSPEAEPGSSSKHVAVGYGRLVMRRFRIGNDWQVRPPHYSVIGPLGRGGMGLVEEARQTSCDRVVALKRLRTDVRIRDGENQLLTEAAVTASLEHPAIPAVYDIGLTEERSPFYVMRKICGRPWSERMPSMTLGDNLQVLLRISEAVDYAHGQGVMHRDIKPENVMLGDYGEVMLVDWGFAAQANDAPNGGHRHAPIVDAMNAMSGSPRWMPPEVARGDIASIGIRSDVYMLGAILRWVLTGKRPHPGETAQECMMAAGDNRFDGVLPPGPLGELAAHATASHPFARPANVGRLISLLREAMRSLEVDRLVAAAQQRAAAGDHHAYLHAEALIQQAVALSADSPIATKALRDLRLARAERALASGDLALAAELTVAAGQAPELDDLRTRIARAQHSRARRRLATVVLAACVVILVVVGTYDQAGQWVARQRQWREVAAWPDGKAASMLKQSTGEAASEHDGVMELSFGRLYALQGDHPAGDIRLEMEAFWSGGIDGLEVGFGAQPAAESWSLPWGYSGQVGGHGGVSTFLARISSDRPASIAEGVEVGLVSGRWYRVAFERSEDELRVVVDGEVVFRHVDPLPPPVQAHGVFLRTWSKSLLLRNLAITRLGHPAQSTPLTVVDALARNGLLAEAVREAMRIADDVGHGELAHRAWTKACLLAVGLPDGKGQQLTALARQRLSSRSEAGRWWSAVLEADAVNAWLSGDFAGAIAVAERARESDPGNRTATTLMTLPRHRLAPADASRLLSLLVQTPGITALDINHLGLEDLAPLKGRSLRRLSVSGNPIRDITPLAGMPLSHVGLFDTPISDVTALQGAPLQFLSLAGTEVTDLGPLRGAPLRTLHLERSRVSDLTPIADCPIESLWLHNTAVRELHPLRGRISDSLVELSLGRSAVEDLSPLAALRGLRSLNIDGTAVSELSGLIGLPLESLSCSETSVRDLDALRGAPLNLLKCSDTLVGDLAPLAQAPLKFLVVDGAPVSDLAPLAHTPLRGLSMSRCPVDDLRPLPATVQEVHAWEAPLAFPPAHPVRLLAHGWPQLDDATWKSGQASWIVQPADVDAVRVMKATRYMAVDDLAGLLQLTMIHGGRRLLHLPVPMSRSAADTWAVRLGGSLYRAPAGSFAATLPGLLRPTPLRPMQRVWCDLKIDDPLRMVSSTGSVHGHPSPHGAQPGGSVYLVGQPSPGFAVAADERTMCEVLVDLGAAPAP